MFQRHFYRRQQQPVEPGPVLSPGGGGGGGEEERLRVRRKLETLELELRAAELVTSDPPRPAPRRQSAEPAAAVSRSPSRLQEEEDCVMCAQEKKLEPGPRVPVRASRSRAQPVHRSKSSAADCLVAPSDGGRRGGSGLGAKIIKRSMSFNRIFNSSMLSRSKEYRL